MITTAQPSIAEAIANTISLTECGDILIRFEVLYFDQAYPIVSHLCSGGTAIVDVQGMTIEDPQRVIDFIAGACEALQRICDSGLESVCLEPYVFAFGQSGEVAELRSPKVLQMSDFRC